MLYYYLFLYFIIKFASVFCFFFFFQAEDGIRDYKVTGVQTCALPILRSAMAVREAVRRRWRGTCSSRSRTTCDFEILRPRDSASMSATSGSGNRTVKIGRAHV